MDGIVSGMNTKIDSIVSAVAREVASLSSNPHAASSASSAAAGVNVDVGFDEELDQSAAPNSPFIRFMWGGALHSVPENLFPA